jgi:hypothetical protein
VNESLDHSFTAAATAAGLIKPGERTSGGFYPNGLNGDLRESGGA